jgi:hypothetical protein
MSKSNKTKEKYYRQVWFVILISKHWIDRSHGRVRHIIARCFLWLSTKLDQQSNTKQQKHTCARFIDDVEIRDTVLSMLLIMIKLIVYEWVFVLNHNEVRWTIQRMLTSPFDDDILLVHVYIYSFIYVYVRVCVCVCSINGNKINVKHPWTEEKETIVREKNKR